MSEAAPEHSPEMPNSAMSALPPEPERAASPPSHPQRRRRFPRAMAAIVVILVVAAALIATQSRWLATLEGMLPSSASKTSAAALDTRLAAIEQRLDALSSLNDRIAALERRPAPDASAAVAPLADRLQQMSARLDAIEARLAQLSKDQSARGDSAQRVLIVALDDLGTAIASSEPFTAQLASVEALAQNRDDWAASLRPLEAAAKTGLPSTAALAQRFSDTVAPRMLRADAAAPSAQEGIGEAILSKLRSLVIVRRIDGTGASGDPVEAAVATAETALQHGDLAAAVSAVNGVEGPAQAPAAAWLQQAQQRVAAEQIVAKLTQQVASDLAAATSGG